MISDKQLNNWYAFYRAAGYPYYHQPQEGNDGLYRVMDSLHLPIAQYMEEYDAVLLCDSVTLVPQLIEEIQQLRKQLSTSHSIG